MSDSFSSFVDTFKNIGGGGEAGDGASGGGGGGMVLPLGVYRTVGGRAAFRPNTVVTLMCLVPVILAAGAAGARAIRAARS